MESCTKRISLFPIFLDIKGKPCLVVGCGETGLRKARALLQHGARVTMIGLDSVDKTSSLFRSKGFTFIQRVYRNAEASNYYLVIAATNNCELNQQIRDDAHQSNALVNITDAPELCDFHTPATVVRGRMQVAISTGGASPTVGRQLKRKFDDDLSQDYEALMDLLMDVRKELRSLIPDKFEQRMKINSMLANSSAIDDYLNGNEVPLIGLIDRLLAPCRNGSSH